MASVFRRSLDFLYELGIYDVVLPFLLVFTIVFAILEKTRIFGEQTIDGSDHTRKDLNSMVAFVIALLVVGSSRLVSIINNTVANVALLLVLVVMFLMLAGSFHDDETFFLEGHWQTTFMVITFIGIILIFLNATDYLRLAYNYVSVYWNAATFSSIILLLLVALAMGFVVREPNRGET